MGYVYNLSTADNLHVILGVQHFQYLVNAFIVDEGSEVSLLGDVCVIDMNGHGKMPLKA